MGLEPQTLDHPCFELLFLNSQMRNLSLLLRKQIIGREHFLEKKNSSRNINKYKGGIEIEKLNSDNMYSM